MSEMLEVIANRIAQMAMRADKKVAKDIGGSGPVLAAVRDQVFGNKIYVGLNTKLPTNVVDVLSKAIADQQLRVAKREIVLVRTSDAAKSGQHAEVIALNAAVNAREAIFGTKLTEAQLQSFELHNVWLKGERSGTAAARCEHCYRITRGVTITSSLFKAEGGQSGEIDAPERAMVTRLAEKNGRPATSASGEVDVAQRGAVNGRPVTTVSGEIKVSGGGGSGGGSPGGAGGGISRGQAVGAGAAGLAIAAVHIARPMIIEWFTTKYLKERWEREQREKIEQTILDSNWRYNIILIARTPDILAEKEAGRRVWLYITVLIEWWYNNDVGWWMAHVNVVDFGILKVAELAPIYKAPEPETNLLSPDQKWEAKYFHYEL